MCPSKVRLRTDVEVFIPVDSSGVLVFDPFSSKTFRFSHKLISVFEKLASSGVVLSTEIERCLSGYPEDEKQRVTHTFLEHIVQSEDAIVASR